MKNVYLPTARAKAGLPNFDLESGSENEKAKEDTIKALIEANSVNKN